MEQYDEYKNSGYYDILIIPTNGTFIDETFNLQTTTTTWRRKSNETTFKVSSTNSSDETIATEVNHICGENIKILNPILYCGRAIKFDRGIGVADWKKEQEDNPIRYTQYQVTLTFNGKTNYFKSNADFYFICGNDGVNDESLYIGSDFPTSKQIDDGKGIVSGYVIYDQKDKEDKNIPICHVAATSLINRTE